MAGQRFAAKWKRCWLRSLSWSASPSSAAATWTRRLRRAGPRHPGGSAAFCLPSILDIGRPGRRPRRRPERWQSATASILPRHYKVGQPADDPDLGPLSGEVCRPLMGRFKTRYECYVLTLAGFAGQPPAALAGPALPRDRGRDRALHRGGAPRSAHRSGAQLGGFVARGRRPPTRMRSAWIIAVDGAPFLPALMDLAADASSGRRPGGRAARLLRYLYAGPASSSSRRRRWRR